MISRNDSTNGKPELNIVAELMIRLMCLLTIYGHPDNLF